MHSRIFGIVEKEFYEQKKNEFDWELVYDEPLYFADYTDNETDIPDDFDWLVQSLVKDTDAALLEVDDKELTITFKPGFKERYFKTKWDSLVRSIIGDPDSFDKFCGLDKDIDFSYRLGKLIDEKYGFYVADEYGSYETLDNFIRAIDYGKTYKVFDTVDYHY